jgi:predicted dienelactone hydrolase
MTNAMQPAIGYAVQHTLDRVAQRPITIDLWYPAADGALEAPHDYGLGRGRVALDAQPRAGRHPALVLSHDAFGAARNYSWIAEHLARSGYCVVGVSHYGESYVYGAETIDQGAAARPWLRAPDCTAALDHVLGESVLARAIDAERIGALGHSSGGHTAIMLAGATFDAAAMARYCASDAAAADRGCGYAHASPAPQAVTADSSYTARDARVRAVVALDPALGPGCSEASLAAVRVPVLVIGAVDNDFLPFEHHASRYGRLLGNAWLSKLDWGEGHFVFLDECRADLEANGVLLGRDRPGVVRAQVHARLRRVITDFFDHALRA